MTGPTWPAGSGACQRPSGWSRGSRSAIAPGVPATSTANRRSCCCTRSRMNGSWFRASFASVKQYSSSPRSTNSRGVHANTSMPSSRPPVSGIELARRRGAAAPRSARCRTARARPRSRASPRPRRRRLVEQPVRLVEPQQVLALDVEHEHAEVRGALADDRRARPSAPAGRTARTTSWSRRRRCRRSTCGRPCARRRSRGRRAPAAVAPEADRQRALHLIGVQRARCVPHRSPARPARRGRRRPRPRGPGA